MSLNSLTNNNFSTFDTFHFETLMTPLLRKNYNNLVINFQYVFKGCDIGVYTHVLVLNVHKLAWFIYVSWEFVRIHLPEEYRINVGSYILEKEKNYIEFYSAINFANRLCYSVRKIYTFKLLSVLQLI